MRIWNSYSSEHSANLVIIGRFTDLADAEDAKRLIEQLELQVRSDPDHYNRDAAPQRQRFSADMLKLLSNSELHSLHPAELDQFLFEFATHLDGTNLIVTTDEIDVSALLKVLIARGARVEVYSAHDHTGTGYGR